MDTAKSAALSRREIIHSITTKLMNWIVAWRWSISVQSNRSRPTPPSEYLKSTLICICPWLRSYWVLCNDEKWCQNEKLARVRFKKCRELFVAEIAYWAQQLKTKISEIWLALGLPCNAEKCSIIGNSVICTNASAPCLVGHVGPVIGIKTWRIFKTIF